MSQHVHGEIGQVVSQDLGEFVTIGGTRIRKDLIIAYTIGGPRKGQGDEIDPYEGLYTVNWMVSGGWNSTEPRSKEECEKDIGRLDWIYKKDGRAEKE